MSSRIPLAPKSLMLAIVILNVIAAFAIGACAQTYTVLHNFGGPGDGSSPSSPLTRDSAGNLYGSTFYGGTGMGGVVYELSPSNNGTWSESVLQDFNPAGNGPDGPLAIDARGNLYGTTLGDEGSIYELSPSGNGLWTLQIIHTFTGGLDGGDPGSPTLLNSNEIYTACGTGETHHMGAVLSLNRMSLSYWSEVFLHNFTGGADGENPRTPLTLDSAGNIYGVSDGGVSNRGVIFEMTPNHNGVGWTKKTLYSFQYPYGTAETPLMFDAAGNLYGVGFEDGSYGYGTVYELTSNPDGGWSHTLLYQFRGLNNGDGAYPDGDLVMDAAGNLYGTTDEGGIANYFCSGGCGTIFKLTPSSGGQWTETILYEPTYGSPVGWGPGGLVGDGAGNLYGLEGQGGQYNGGLIFKLTP